MSVRSGAGSGVGIVARMARLACPKAERPWVDAMFAELDSVDGGQRSDWASGVIEIVLAAVAIRVRTVPAGIRAGIACAMCAILLFALGSRAELELVTLDDDVLFQGAMLSGAVSAGFGILAIIWIFNATDPA